MPYNIVILFSSFLDMSDVLSDSLKTILSWKMILGVTVFVLFSSLTEILEFDVFVWALVSVAWLCLIVR